MAATKSESKETSLCHPAPGKAWVSCLRAGALAAGLILATSRCGAGSSDSGFSASPAGEGNVGGDFGPSDDDGGGSLAVMGGAGGGSSGAAALPAETKTESNYQSPVATGNVVWIANPTSGLVAYIDAATFDVSTVEAGDGPTYLAAVPDPTDDVAIVLNVLSQDATLLRDHLGTLSATTFPSTADANSWAVSTSGRWAIAWTNATLITTTDPTQGFQDVAVLDLSGARPPQNLSVGYRPSQIAFSGDETRAFAVTQDGISVVDLLGGTQPTVVSNFPLNAPVAQTIEATTDASSPDGSVEASVSGSQSDDAGTGSSTPDVSFTPDGSYALVRTDGVAAITVISLAQGVSTAVPLPSPPTDLDMSPDGTFALAVLRDNSAVVTLPIPDIFNDPTSFTTTTITGEIVGRAIITQKTASGQFALLFTTAAPIARLTVLTLQAMPTYRTIVLHSPVLAVFPTDDAQNAIVLNSVTPDPAANVEGAFSIVPIGADLPAKIVGVPATPTAVALAPTSDHALISIRDDTTSTWGLYLALMPSLEVVNYTLASPPIAVGIAAGAARGYVAQDYSEGRITFVDLGTEDCDAQSPCEQARTITGFDLGARVVTGANP
ncbi:MAG: YncE family protein [Polyangiaceae bacterium]